MIISALRIFFIVIPMILFVWSMVYNDSFMATFQKMHEIQGKDGLLVINQPGKTTVGENFGDWLEEKFGKNADTEWQVFFTRVGRDIDTLIRYIEDFWLWIIIASFLIAGGIILYIYRDYK